MTTTVQKVLLPQWKTTELMHILCGECSIDKPFARTSEVPYRIDHSISLLTSPLGLRRRYGTGNERANSLRYKTVHPPRRENLMNMRQDWSPSDVGIQNAAQLLPVPPRRMLGRPRKLVLEDERKWQNLPKIVAVSSTGT